MAVLCRL